MKEKYQCKESYHCRKKILKLNISSDKSLNKHQRWRVQDLVFVRPPLLLLLSVDLFAAVYVHFWGSVRYAGCTVLSAAGASEQSVQVCTDQKSTMNESSSAGAGESTWSSGQQMKMENCYHLWGLFKYMQAGEVVRSWWMPHVPAVVDMIKKIPGPTPPPPSPFTTIIDKQMCAGRPQAQKIACVQNCLWDEKFCLFVVRVQSCFWVQVDC